MTADQPRDGTGEGGRRTGNRFPASVGADKFTADFLEGLRAIGDPEADDAVAEFFAATATTHVDLFRHLGRISTSGLPDENLPGLSAFVAEEVPWPAWAEDAKDLVDDGQRVFDRWGPQLGMGLFMASLPATYVKARGAETLVRTARMSDNPRRRILETCQMLLDVMTPDALVPGKKGYATIRHVRLVHAAVRYVLTHHDEVLALTGKDLGAWDEAALGVPVNQADLLGCMFSFSVIGLRSLIRSGVTLSDDEQAAYNLTVNLFGHQLGLRDDLLPLSVTDSSVIWDAISAAEDKESDAGSELTGHLVACIQELAVFKHLKGLPATGIRFYLGDETADRLHVDQADWTRHFFSLVMRTDSVLGRVVERMGGRHSLSAIVGREVIESFELSRRQGDRPGFRVSDELREAWGITSV